MAVLSSEQNQFTNMDLLTFTEGIFFDRQLVDAECTVQQAWVQALLDSSLLSTEEAEKIQAVLERLIVDLKKEDFPWRIDCEDIHMHIEWQLTKELGSLGEKIHLGRSRNDLIATTLRVKASELSQELAQQIKKNLESWISLAEKYDDVIVPGLSHLQWGQPLPLAQMFLAYAWMAVRILKSCQRWQDSAMAVMPLGSAAFNGTHLQIDLQKTAQKLGFRSPPQNSYDCVFDRDFLVEGLAVYSQWATHIAKQAQDLIYLSSQAVGYVDVPEKWSTGSSIMPNKRNPDVLELARAKASRIASAWAQAQSLLQATGTGYFSDLHELKKVFLTTASEVKRIATPYYGYTSNLVVNTDRIRNIEWPQYLMATDRANDLVESGFSFRNAYREVAKSITQGMYLDVEVLHEAVEKRQNAGGSSQESRRLQIRQLREWI